MGQLTFPSFFTALYLCDLCGKIPVQNRVVLQGIFSLTKKYIAATLAGVRLRALAQQRRCQYYMYKGRGGLGFPAFIWGLASTR